MSKDIYVLGTGLSHNGSAVILKNGEVAVAIEKERLTRVKHDGGNDSSAIQYCLDALGITLDDVSVAVQCENFVTPERDSFQGDRPFKARPDVALHTVSHHLAHAYSAIGTCPFDEFNVLIIDGCGSPHEQCTESLPQSLSDLGFEAGRAYGLICEKDSFYHFDGIQLTPVFKDFSEMDVPGGGRSTLPTTRHSIGGFYAYISNYCFGNMNDAGKLMGLAPYGKPGQLDEFDAFELRDGRVFVKDDWKVSLGQPAFDFQAFQQNFQYYADIAWWAQKEVEKAILFMVEERIKRTPDLPLCYSGGVALNAVANAKVLKNKLVESFYIEPAAADNGLALGCAYYGWLELLKGKRTAHSGSTCFGKAHAISADIISQSDHKSSFESMAFEDAEELYDAVAKLIDRGKTVGWYQAGCEFGPRALGRRSILASPFHAEMQLHINRNIKFREDFRPFAPAVLKEDVNNYFVHGFESPYMILVDEVREEWKLKLKAVSHVDGSARVQTVQAEWNPAFHGLLKSLKEATGHGMVLNTSFNKRGQPIVETPEQAFALFDESALDVLVLENLVLVKH